MQIVNAYYKRIYNNEKVTFLMSGDWWALHWAVPWALPWALVERCGDRALRGPGPWWGPAGIGPWWGPYKHEKTHILNAQRH